MVDKEFSVDCTVSVPLLISCIVGVCVSVVAEELLIAVLFSSDGVFVVVLDVALPDIFGDDVVFGVVVGRNVTFTDELVGVNVVCDGVGVGVVFGIVVDFILPDIVGVGVVFCVVFVVVDGILPDIVGVMIGIDVVTDVTLPVVFVAVVVVGAAVTFILPGTILPEEKNANRLIIGSHFETFGICLICVPLYYPPSLPLSRASLTGEVVSH